MSPGHKLILRSFRSDHSGGQDDQAFDLAPLRYAWVTLALYLITLSGHWIFDWFAYVQEQPQHGQAVEVGGYTIQMLRDTLENWQSEFLQLIWQVAGLTFLLHVGSPQSKEGDDRMEAKIDPILLAVESNKGNRI